MKTISLSALILIAFPFCVLAQDVDSYYSKDSKQFAPEVNHILPSQSRSTRKGVVQQAAPIVDAPTFKPSTYRFESKAQSVALVATKPATIDAPTLPTPAVQQETKFRPIENFKFEPPKVSALNYLISRDAMIPNAKDDALPNIQQTTQHQEISGGDFNPRPVARTARQVIESVELPKPAVSSQDFPEPNDVVKPTPQNTFQLAEPPRPQVAIESIPPNPISEREYNETFTEQTPSQPESASLDHIRMSQRVNSWDQNPGTMRDIGDHFSPGGEPFAYRGVTGNANFFGVDRRSCCDEWSGFCNCSGGLKANPGHLGNPYLRSKENCDTAKRVFGKHRGRKAANSCGCSDCCK